MNRNISQLGDDFIQQWPRSTPSGKAIRSLRRASATHGLGFRNGNAFDRRIDFVFYRGAGMIPVQAEVIDLSLDRTLPPLWASDHAALAAGFFIQRPLAIDKGRKLPHEP